MEIRIIALRLRNFKGVREAEYFFDGKNARIEGPNGSGKSTVFDAFTWLLFGKDHKGQTADTFELKTIDPSTGKPYPREDHWVEAVLSVDGLPRVLRRAWVENWVKPTGLVEDVMRGHTSAFYVDGVDVVTKKAYDAVIAGWIEEAAFKLLTNPHFFIDDSYTGWKERRKALMDLVADSPERARVRKEFADVIDRLSGRSLEDYRRKLAAEKAANKRDLAACLSRIDGIREALPEQVDEVAVNDQVAALKAERDGIVAGWRDELTLIDKALAGADEADEARKAENAAIWAEITKVQLWMGNYIAEAKKAAQTQNNKRQQDIMDARRIAEEAGYKMSGEKAQEERTRKELEGMELDRGRFAKELADLGERYRAERARAFEYTPQETCPYCGQPMPAATVEEAREKAHEAFLAERKAMVAEIMERARKIKAEAGELEARMAGMQDIIEKSRQEYNAAAAKHAEWTEKARRLEEETPVVDMAEAEQAARRSPEFRAKAKEEAELQVKAFNTKHRADGTEELVQQRAGIEKKIRDTEEEYRRKLEPLQERLTVNRERQRQEEVISRKEREAKDYADAIASEERLEARAAEFMKADIDSVEEAINGLFRVARWKMFDRTLDGGIVETCEVTSRDGVPYRSMNDAMKILCGLDVIRVFSERSGRQAPIFIDNAEGILRDRFDTGAQVIRLVVKDTAKLNLINE